jgi:phosphoglycerol transferase MdoB-like AlkP superfamily enzyme
MPTATDANASSPPRWAGPAALIIFVIALALEERKLLSDRLGAELPPLLNSLSVPLAVAGLALLVPAPWRWIWLGLMGTGLSILISFDKGGLEYFHQPVGLAMAPAIPQLWDVRESSASLLTAGEVLWTFGFGGFVVYGLIAMRGRRRGPSRTRWQERAAGLMLLAVTAVPLSVAFQQQAMPRSALELKHPAVRYVRNHGFWLYHVWDIVDTLRESARRGEMDPATERLVAATFAHSQELNATSSPLFGVAAGRNVVLVQLEAVQQFVLDMAVPAGPVTPVLNRLASQGLVWDHCMDVTMLGRTSDAEFVLMTGLLPHRRKMVALTHINNDWVTLPRVLGARGYSTVSMHAYERTFWNRAVAHPSYGIDQLRFAESFTDGRKLAWGLADEDFFVQAADLLAAQPQPFFALLISLSSHHPFNEVPEELANWDTGLPEHSMGANYLRLVHYTDSALQRLLDTFAAHDLLESTMFVIYGDHGAGLDASSSGQLAEVTGRNPSHPTERRVPLVVVIPGAEEQLAAHREAYRGIVGGMHDIAPTVLHLLGIEVPAGFVGTHLFVPQAQRELMPLSMGNGFVVNGEVYSNLDAPESERPEDVARLDAWAREAWLRLKLADVIIEYDAQTTAPRAADEALGVLLAEVLGDEVPQTLPPWSARRTDKQPLPTGRWIVPTIPPPTAGFHLRLELDNTAKAPRAWELSGMAADGRQVLTLSGTLDAGASTVISLQPDPSEATGTLAYAVVSGEPGVNARSWLRHALGTRPQPLLQRLAARTRVEGPTDGIATVAVVLINPTDAVADVKLEARLGDKTIARETITLPAGGYHAQAVPVPSGQGDIQLVVSGSPVAVHWIRWNADRVPYR